MIMSLSIKKEINIGTNAQNLKKWVPCGPAVAQRFKRNANWIELQSIEGSPTQQTRSWEHLWTSPSPWSYVRPCTSAVKGGGAWHGLVSLWTPLKGKSSLQLFSNLQLQLQCLSEFLSCPHILQWGQPWHIMKMGQIATSSQTYPNSRRILAKSFFPR